MLKYKYEKYFFLAEDSANSKHIQEFLFKSGFKWKSGETTTRSYSPIIIVVDTNENYFTYSSINLSTINSNLDFLYNRYSYCTKSKLIKEIPEIEFYIKFGYCNMYNKKVFNNEIK